MASRFWMGVLSLGAATLVACSSTASPSASSPGGPGGAAGQVRGGRTVAVSVVPVTKGTIQSVLTYSGNIQAKAQVNLTPRASGRVEKLFVDVGDTVKAGDVIAQLDQSTARIQVQQAEAALAVAASRLANMKAGARPLDIAAAEAAVRSAEARLDQLTPTELDVASAQAAVRDAEVSLANTRSALVLTQKSATVSRNARDRENEHNWYERRYGETLDRLNRGEANQEELDKDWSNLLTAKEKLDSARVEAELSLRKAENDVVKAEDTLTKAKDALERLLAGPRAADLAAALAALDQARSQLELKRVPYTAEDIRGTTASVEQSQAAVDSAKLALAETTLVAPFDGVIASRSVSEGAMATAQTAVVSIVSTEIDLSISIEEGRIALLRPGLPVELAVPAYPGTTFAGAVSLIAPVADARSHTFQVRVAPRDGDRKLRPGMFADVRLTTDKREGALLVPRDAMLRRGDKEIVFVARDGAASLRNVRVGLTDDKNVEILEGVAADDQVVVAGLNSLNDGDRLLIPGQAERPGMSPGGQGAGPGGQRGQQGERPGGQQDAKPGGQQEGRPSGQGQGGPRPSTTASPSGRGQ